MNKTILTIKLLVAMAALEMVHPAIAKQERKCELYRKFISPNINWDDENAMAFAQWELTRLYSLVQQ